jgi:hypothetical protein
VFGIDFYNVISQQSGREREKKFPCTNTIEGENFLLPAKQLKIHGEGMYKASTNTRLYKPKNGSVLSLSFCQ